jgi:hypothetical protein
MGMFWSFTYFARFEPMAQDANTGLPSSAIGKISNFLQPLANQAMERRQIWILLSVGNNLFYPLHLVNPV